MLSARHDRRTDLRGPAREPRQANKLSRTYAALLEALNRHRGKGQQKVTVEHVHVHAGGQAVVGMVDAPARGGGSPEIGGTTPCKANCPCTSARDAVHGQGAGARAGRPRCRTADAGCTAESRRAPKGNKNALKHGRYTAEAIANRREIATLLRKMNALARNCD